MKISRFRIGLTDLMVVLSFLMLITTQLTGIANDPGLGVHLKTGEIIREQQTVPRNDPFLASSYPRAWVADSWLGSTTLSLLVSQLGWPFVYCVSLIIFCFTFWGVLLPLCIRSSESALLSAVATSISLKLATIHFVIRPVLLSLTIFSICFAVLLSVEFNLRQKDARNIRVLWSMPLLFLLWANLHPYFFLGLILFAILIVALLLESLITSEYVISKSTWSQIITIFVLSILTTFLNPYGWHLHETIIGLGTNPFFTDFLSEWRSLNFKTPEGLVVELIILIVSFGFIAANKINRKSYGIFGMLAFLAFLHFGLQSVRGIALFAIVASPALAYALRAIFSLIYFERFSFLALTRRIATRLENYEKKTAEGLLGLTFCSLAIIVATLFTHKVPFYRGEYGPSQKIFPFKALDFLKAHVGNGKATVATEINWGGFVIGRGFPTLQPIIDDRLTLLPQNSYLENARVFNSEGSITNYLKNNSAQYLLLPVSSRLSALVGSQSDFKKLWHDEVADLYEFNK